MREIMFFDTTMRDGEQTPGAHMNVGNKLEIARQLERMGVNIIEAGFPASSKGDFRAVEEISQNISQSRVAALARASKNDILMAGEALAKAKLPRLHVFIATSDIHLKYKLRMTREQVLSRVTECVAYAKTLCPQVQFSAEDATRSDVDYLCSVLLAAAEAGADIINIADTVGYAGTAEFGALVKTVYDRVVSRFEGRILSVHCHNDLGLAVANTLAAIENGASQVECTINGLGERAGNAAFEEVVMGLTVRRDIYGATHNIVTNEISKTSRLVSSASGIAVPPNKAIVGVNAFMHDAGIHQHGMMCDRRTYEIMLPESVGITERSVVLGKLTGRHAFAARAAELGYELDEATLETSFESFKYHADKKPVVTDEDIMAIINEQLDALAAVYSLDTFQIQSGNKMSSMAMITLKRLADDTLLSDSALGKGPIDAAFYAINKIARADVKLESYNLKAVTEGTDALGEVMVKVRAGDASFTGRGVSSDIIKASIKAYVSAIGKHKIAGLTEKSRTEAEEK